MNDYSERRLRRGRQLYIRLRFKTIKIGDIDALVELGMQMQELGFYACTTSPPDVVFGIMRHHWKQTIGGAIKEKWRTWHEYMHRWFPHADYPSWRRAIRESRARLTAESTQPA